jgi:hypothetical protein
LIIAGTACGAILSDEGATLASIIASFVNTIEVAEKASAPAEGRAYDA